MNKLKTIDGETLMSKPLVPIRFVVQQLIPTGLHILAGAPKVGKSWLALWLCLQVAKGESVWTFAAEKRTTLYLCLEDSEARIQNRLFDVTDDAPDNVHFTVTSNLIGDGLETQIEDFVAEHEDVGLIVIDTFQKVRRASLDNAYANDYRELGELKKLADKLGVAIVLIHHLRKQRDDDPLNMVSGTTAITGAVDSSFVLRRDSRGSQRATLVCDGRDIDYRELQLEFDKETHLWSLLGDSFESNEAVDDVISLVYDFIKTTRNFYGTPTELAEILNCNCERRIAASVLSKKLIQHHHELEKLGISHAVRQSNSKRYIELTISDGSGEQSDNSKLAVAGLKALEQAV